MFRRVAISGLMVCATLTASARTRPHYGGTLRVEIRGDAWAPDGLARRLVMNPLTELGDDGEAQPALAVGWNSQNDNQRWAFQLRPGVSFQDDTPLLMFSLTIVAVVAGFAWTASMRVRRVFEDQNREQTAALVNQFQKEFAQRASDISAAMDRMASSDSLKRIAFKLGNGGDAASYLTTAATLAGEYQLDDLELVDSQGNIISSAQWPARFGYHEPAIAMAGAPAFRRKSHCRMDLLR